MSTRAHQVELTKLLTFVDLDENVGYVRQKYSCSLIEAATLVLLWRSERLAHGVEIAHPHIMQGDE